MNILPLDQYSYNFPDPLLASNEGVLAYGGDLNPNRILKAYMSGIFPWYKKYDPILWWSPNPRFVLFLDEFKVSKSLQKTINNNTFEIRYDSAFEEVINQCANVKRKEQKGSWIVPEMIEAYCELHKMGFAHSCEAYYKGELVGGGYGLVLGDIFYGESMFALKNDASKVAFVYMVERLKSKGFRMIDCKIPSDHLRSFGARLIHREKFLKYVQSSLNKPLSF